MADFTSLKSVDCYSNSEPMKDENFELQYLLLQYYSLQETAGLRRWGNDFSSKCTLESYKFNLKLNAVSKFNMIHLRFGK